MFYAALGIIMCTVWAGALLILPILQQRELKGAPAREPQQEPAGKRAHAMA
ncbi:MAG: hypothetical protein ICCCNLDF_01670 [Planctomycetes bacterium]|nr:hypothetical protein [Planctomycetota bacterium]